MLRVYVLLVIFTLFKIKYHALKCLDSATMYLFLHPSVGFKYRNGFASPMDEKQGMHHVMAQAQIACLALGFIFSCLCFSFFCFVLCPFVVYLISFAFETFI